MKVYLFICFLMASVFVSHGQTLYFPPLSGDQWDTISPSSLGWCDHRIDSMYDMLEENQTKAFILLKDGKIVLEKYFDAFTMDSIWYWASAGKSLTACLVGIAEQKGMLSFEDTTSQYLGTGWTACTLEEEDKITVRHQLTMTTGLDDGDDPDCTIDTCLVYKADAGSRWAYHNAPYTLLDEVITSATGQTLNSFLYQNLSVSTGISGLYLPIEYNNVFFSKPRAMARFGLMILGKGSWDGNQILTDTAFFNRMVNTSQSLNLSYGYLWWLNGKASYMLPTLQFVFPGSLLPNAPDDMIAALGRNGQFVNVVPSQNLVLIRMGNAPDGNAVPVTLNDKIWEHINGLNCMSTSTQEQDEVTVQCRIYPNPSSGRFKVSVPHQSFTLTIHNQTGECVLEGRYFDHTEAGDNLAPGVYILKMETEKETFVKKMVLTN